MPSNHSTFNGHDSTAVLLPSADSRRLLSATNDISTGYPLIFFVCLFFVGLHPKSTAVVMARGSVHLTTLFPGQA